ncbi:MAG: ABC transporter permease, partial [Verrucomicrobiota bacterium]|nr:ABC transporter permease [Verrucomicrobiota bacterium]
MQISADRVGVTTVFIAGDRVSKEYFPTFAQAVRSENMETRKARKLDQPKSGSKRDNLKKLRHLAPLAIANGWLESDERQDDEKIFEIWKGLAEGTLISSAVVLSEENLAVVQDNWQTLSAASSKYDPKR